MKRTFLAAILIFGSVSIALADAGVLEATNAPANARNPLKLRRMEVMTTVDRQHAFVRVLQLFENTTNTDLEGTYTFRIPEGAAITDFAIWEDGVRIPGVILERRKARAIYEELTANKIDPGLLEASEGEEDRNEFIVRVYPIPARGVKRIELSYEQPIEVTSLRSRFSFPLAPQYHEQQRAEKFVAKFTLYSGVPVESLESSMGDAKFETGQGDDGRNAFHRTFEADGVDFAEDLAFEWKLSAPENTLDVIAYRDVTRKTLDISPDGGRTYKDDTGYFLAIATFKAPPEGEATPPRDIVFALDTSLSMQGKKLESAFDTISDFLGRLGPNDKFTVCAFSDRVDFFSKKPIPADAAKIDAALNFIKSESLAGATDLIGALETSVEALSGSSGKPIVVLITDGHPTMNVIAYRAFLDKWKAGNKNGARVFIFGIGADANAELLSVIASSADGYFTWAEETEDLEFKLDTFFDKVGAEIIGDLKLSFSDPSNFTMVYPADPQKTFAGGAMEFVGKYLKPGGVDFTVTGNGVKLTKRVDLPDADAKAGWIRRVWAKARVSHLLTLIRYEGEKDEWIEEIIALAKEFKFVTSYTSFLAAPRALLRPRVIKPGDPILRVRTDESVKSVTAVFPFGLIKPLKRIERDSEKGDLWEVRFLAPKWMQDGSYKCDLILVDDGGRTYAEQKDFIIDGRPPTLDAELPETSVAAGSSLKIIVDADPDTRWIRARIEGLPAAELKWDPSIKKSVGLIPIPSSYPPGSHEITVTAEDFARNSAAISLEVTVRGGGK